MVQPHEPDRGPTITDTYFRQLQSIEWKEPESRRLQKETGDPNLWIGWLGWNQCHWIARTTRVLVDLEAKFGLYVPPTQETVRYPFQPWVLNGVPQPLDVARIAKHVMGCRTDREETYQESARALDADGSRRKRTRDSAMDDAGNRLKGDFGRIQRDLLDPRYGFVGREAGGGERKFFYDGALVQDGAAGKPSSTKDAS